LLISLSLSGSGDQDGLAGQSPGGGLVVDGGQVGQRPPFGDVDLQVAGVDAGDESPRRPARDGQQN